MQTMHETAQRLWSPLGPAQRYGRRGPRYAGQKRPMATSLAKRLPRHDSRPPKTLVTHCQAGFVDGRPTGWYNASLDRCRKRRQGNIWRLATRRSRRRPHPIPLSRRERGAARALPLSQREKGADPVCAAPNGRGDQSGHIALRGVRVHNLKSIDLDIPHRNSSSFAA